ncbi:aminoacyl-tRNA hydrolase [Candidatus Woesearchaeota archaeon]|jgi:PTH2 family peptidyl-tRNA hydrolase|nr:aminoacyl-tRNA hydrolase [Candidatus Woesearchaeota archaeon]|tara:strand:- start:8319 stop:8663 length:345 start_codon:yes stop_codon:yes gene_type:complete
MTYKQVILVRHDLKLPKGKLATQVAHASLEAASNSYGDAVREWRNQGGKKVVLKVENLDELLKYKDLCKSAKLKTALIKDAGHTVVEPGTITCLGVGPDTEEKIDKITGKLKMV